MRIREILWLDTILEKIQTKHGVEPDEAEYVLEHNPVFRFTKKGHVKGEDVYSALGRTAAGRYLIVFFIRKQRGQVLPISARQMTATEKKLYARQKKSKD
jgi:uncharacterized protein